ncbi:MAG: hypothetical protein ACKVLF_07425, partial [Nitrospinaceae bacterium]
INTGSSKISTTQGLLLAFTQSSEFLCGIGFVIIEKKYWLLLFPGFGRGTFKTIFNIINTSIMWKKVVTGSHLDLY